MLEYNMDLSAASHSRIFTVDSAARAFPFYMTECGFFEAGPGYYTRRDGKNELLLIHTHSGEGSLTWKGQTCALGPKTAIVFHCGSYHEYHTASREPWTFSWVHLCGAGADSFASLLLERPTPVPISLDHIISGQFQRLFQVNVAADILEYAEISHCLSTLLLELLRARAQAAASGPTVRKDEISTLAEYIARHYDQPLTLDDCMRVARLSRYYLIRLFRQQMGMPPCQYLHKCRINRAQELLRSTQDSISRIGAQVGYADPVVFIRHFRRMVGVTPSVYRKESTVMPGRR